ncbi:unnamed protein product, partial [Darwinula stevensoni]
GLKAYPNVAALPETPDAAIIAVPAAQVIATVQELGARGVPVAIIFSSGFAETGPDGVAAQAQLVATARQYGMRILGPNCMGAFNTRSGWYAMFTTAFEQGWPKPGPIGMVSQSGAFATYLVCLARERGIGTPACVTTGNESDITVGEVIEWYVNDPHTKVIVAYAEGIKESASFIRGLAAAQKAGKPVVIMKVGRSELGHSAAQSHTASVAGDDAVTDAVLTQYGALRAHSTEELLDFAYAASCGIYPAHNTLGVITISGG